MRSNINRINKLQKLSLSEKIELSSEIIKDWYTAWDGDVYVSFSGGKDSTALLSLVREIYPDVEGMFLDTGLEYPEIRNFVKSIKNITWVRPKIKFMDIINKYGYPIISKEVSESIFKLRTTRSIKLKYKLLYGKKNGSWKIPEKWKFLIHSDIKISHKCCDFLKKYPSREYNKRSGKYPLIGMMASDSRRRMTKFKTIECNYYDTKNPTSNPLYFWTDKDVWKYIKNKKIRYSKIYDMGYKRTCCMFCMFGVHLEKPPNKFQLMSKTHPNHYRFCMDKLGLKDIMVKLGIPYQLPEDKIKKFFSRSHDEELQEDSRE